MSISLKFNRSKSADFLMAMLALTPAVVIYYRSFSPEAAVYFTFIKNFFVKPFSFHPGEVSFGATSPLHVMLYAPIHALFGSAWLTVSKFINLTLIVIGMYLLNRTIKGGTKTILMISLLVALSTGLLVSASQLYETGLAFLAMAWIYYDLNERKFERATLVAGSLYLIRPELFMVTIAVLAYVIYHARASKRSLVFAGVSFVPAFVYHMYMLAAGGGLFPSSFFVPIVTYIQHPASWLDRLGTSLSSLWGAPGVVYLASAVVIILLLAERAHMRYTRELLLIAPLIGLYFVFPPEQNLIRYLVPITPILIAVMVRYVQQELKAQYTVKALVICLVLAHGYGTAAASRLPKHNQDNMMLRELSGQMNALAGSEQPVLVYDVQCQYYLDAPCYSLTSSVGDHMLDAHLKRSAMPQVLLDQEVRYLITSDALRDHYLFRNTMMNQLDLHDRTSSVGDTVEIEGVVFEKMFSNSRFVRASAMLASADPDDATGLALQVDPVQMATQWNSVYRVLGDAATVQAQALAAALQAEALQAQLDSVTTEAPPAEDSAARTKPAEAADSAVVADSAEAKV